MIREAGAEAGEPASSEGSRRPWKGRLLAATRVEREGLGRWLLEDLAATPGAFKFNVTDAQRQATTLEEALKAYGIQPGAVEIERKRDGKWLVHDLEKDGARSPQAMILKSAGDRSWQVNSIRANNESSRVYQAIYSWLHSSGQQTVPDDTYTAEGTFRRLS